MFDSMEHVEQFQEKTPYRVQARDMDHFAEMTGRKDVRITRALVDSIMGSADPSHPEGVTIEFEDGSYAVVDLETDQTPQLMNLLRDAIEDFEREEWYELCDGVKRFLDRWQVLEAERQKAAGDGEPQSNPAKK